MKLTDERIVMAADKVADKINKLLRTKKRKTRKHKESFDINQYEFSDIVAEYEKVDPSILDVKFFLTDREHLTLNKKDSIALAKHFKLTESDLK